MNSIDLFRAILSRDYNNIIKLPLENFKKFTIQFSKIPNNIRETCEPLYSRYDNLNFLECVTILDYEELVSFALGHNLDDRIEKALDITEVKKNISIKNILEKRLYRYTEYKNQKLEKEKNCNIKIENDTGNTLVETSEGCVSKTYTSRELARFFFNMGRQI